MATVPLYGGPQVAPTAGRGPAFQASSAPSPLTIVADQAQRLGGAMESAGGAVGKIALAAIDQANQVRVSDAMNKAVQAKLRYTYDPEVGYVHLRGLNAVERPDGKALDEEFDEKLQADLSKISEGLGNDQQRRLFTIQADQLRQQFRASTESHFAKEYGDYRVGVQRGTITTAQDQMGLSWGNPVEVEQGRNAVKASVAEMGRMQGWSGGQIEAVMREELSRGHAAVISGALQAGRSGYAAEYLKQVGPELTPQAKLQLTGQVKDVDDSVRGDAGAEDAWVAAGPKGPNDAVRIFDMEKIVREKLGDEPKVRDAALAGLRQRAAAFNAQQSEANAAGVNGVYRQLDSGASIASVQRSPEWLALSDKGRHDIIKGFEAEAAVRESRAAARENRAAAADQRAYTNQLRAEKQSLMQNGDAYLAYSSPDTLAGMSRTEVQALRPKFGMEATGHLLDRWDGLQKKGAAVDARIDTEDFNRYAEELGLRPYDKSKTEAQSSALGTLKYRVEQLIDTAQIAKKGALTREEKGEIMRQQMATTVSVDRWYGQDKVPVIQMTKKQAENVIVPPEEHNKIAEALGVLYKMHPNDPRYAPTQDNVRREYLNQQGPAARLVNGQ